MKIPPYVVDVTVGGLHSVRALHFGTNGVSGVGNSSPSTAKADAWWIGEEFVGLHA